MDPKELISQSYDSIAEPYLQWTKGQHTPRERYTNLLLSHISSGAGTCGSSPPHILELGCGAGIPTTRLLLYHGAQVTANDISPTQLNLARTYCPAAEFILGDMMTVLSFEPASLDGVVSFFAIFHLPREEQRGMLAKIYQWLKPGGMLVFNLGTGDEEVIKGQFLGKEMFWSGYGVEGSLQMVKEVGFELVKVEVLEAGSEDGDSGPLPEDDPDFGISFLWIAAKKVK